MFNPCYFSSINLGFCIREFLVKNKPLFEAGFEFDNYFARADIIAPNGDGWDIIEVKSSTKTKDKFIHF